MGAPYPNLMPINTPSAIGIGHPEPVTGEQRNAFENRTTGSLEMDQ